MKPAERGGHSVNAELPRIGVRALSRCVRSKFVTIMIYVKALGSATWTSYNGYDIVGHPSRLSDIVIILRRCTYSRAPALDFDIRILLLNNSG